MKHMALDIETLGLNCFKDRIVSITYTNLNGEMITQIDKDEKAILSKFFSDFHKEKPDFIVTYNGDGFDVPFITARSYLYNIDPIELVKTKHLDLCWVMRKYFKTQSYDSSLGKKISFSLSDFARFLGFEVKDEIKGSEIPILFEKGEYGVIVAHNQSDVRLLQKIYERLESLCLYDLQKRYDENDGDNLAGKIS